MSRTGKFTETKQISGSQGMDGGGSDRVFFRGDENILVLGSGEGCITL